MNAQDIQAAPKAASAERHKVIAHINLPTRAPVCETITAILVLDRFAVPGWLWVIASLAGLAVWLMVLNEASKEREVDILP